MSRLRALGVGAECLSYFISGIGSRGFVDGMHVIKDLVIPYICRLDWESRLLFGSDWDLGSIA